MNMETRKIEGSSIFLGNAAFAMSCIIVIMTMTDSPLGFCRAMSLFLLAVTTPILIGQYFMQYVFTGYTGNILVSITAVAISILGYCFLVWSIRWWAGLLFTVTAWYYFVYIVRRVNTHLDRLGIKPENEI